MQPRSIRQRQTGYPRLTAAKLSSPIITRAMRIFAVLLILCSVAYAGELRGRVADESGAVIPGAQIQLTVGSQTYNAISNGAGAFSITASAGKGMLRVSATGFAPASLDWTGSASPISITLKPAAIADTVIVTGERSATSIEQTAANVVVLNAWELSNHAALTLDDALRQVPGFTLFRRSNSLTANPTTQGASARGVGASGASRMLVLEDGVPLNDAFGGWVFWDQLPRIALDHAEVLRGGGSSLYGSSALGGIVALTQKTGNLIALETSGDSLAGHDVQGRISRQLHGWDLTASGENFGNDGSFVVASANRGLIDTPDTLAFSNGTVRAQHSLGNNGTAFVSGSLFAEQRNNGTVLQINSTHLGELRAGLDDTLDKNVFSLRIYGSGEHYHQSFSSIAADRNSEALTRWQTAPSDQVGFSAYWTRPFAATQFTAGIDGRFIHGESDETAFAAGLPTSLVSSGGRNNILGSFIEISQTIKRRLRVSGGVRLDWWSNLNGFNSTTPLSTLTTTFTPLNSHQETAWSPRLGAVYDLAAQWQLTASAYGGFRAPTLNELYRSFRLGNVLTLANEALGAEHVHGGEAGIRYLRRRVLLNASFFQQNVENPVANVTESTTATLITRQRENLGSLRARGIDSDVLFLLPHIQLRAGYEYVHSLVSSFSQEPALVGKQVPQVPSHTFTFSTSYNAPRNWTVVALLRASSRQFDDDLNQFELAPYSVLDFSISKQIGVVTWFASAGNILDTRIQTAATPILNYGSPRIISGGMRFTTKH
ncbi:MAG TPA: TonB-dependent receptor [Candidatus Angelobacter sp.]|jgi:outer membrane receptor protein involved in Fe transport|nr:TonB-dependent receptor [Candidatus Angelobacter sp.]